MPTKTDLISSLYKRMLALYPKEYRSEFESERFFVFENVLVEEHKKGWHEIIK